MKYLRIFFFTPFYDPFAPPRLLRPGQLPPLSPRYASVGLGYVM